MSFSNLDKSPTPSFSNTNHSATPTFGKVFRHGAELTLGDISDLTFNDTIYGDNAIKDMTFEDVGSQPWVNVNKS
jgi:hypothetical protein